MTLSSFPSPRGESSSVCCVQPVITWQNLQKELLGRIFCLVSADQSLHPVGKVCHRWRAVAFSIARPGLLIPDADESSTDQVSFKMCVPVSFTPFDVNVRMTRVDQKVCESTGIRMDFGCHTVKQHVFKCIETCTVHLSPDSFLIGGNSENTLFLKQRKICIYNLYGDVIFRWFSLPAGFGYGEPNVVNLAAISTLTPSDPGTMMIMLASASHLIVILGSERLAILPLDNFITAKVLSLAFSDEGAAYMMDTEQKIYQVLLCPGDRLEINEVDFVLTRTPWRRNEEVVVNERVCLLPWPETHSIACLVYVERRNQYLQAGKFFVYVLKSRMERMRWSELQRLGNKCIMLNWGCLTASFVLTDPFRFALKRNRIYDSQKQCFRIRDHWYIEACPDEPQWPYSFWVVPSSGVLKLEAGSAQTVYDTHNSRNNEFFLNERAGYDIPALRNGVENAQDKGNDDITLQLDGKFEKQLQAQEQAALSSDDTAVMSNTDKIGSSCSSKAGVSDRDLAVHIQSLLEGKLGAEPYTVKEVICEDVAEDTEDLNQEDELA